MMSHWIDSLETEAAKRRADAWEEYHALVGRQDLSKAEAARIAVLIKELDRPVEQVRRDAQLCAEMAIAAELAKTKQERQEVLSKTTTDTDAAIAKIQRQREALDASEADLVWQLQRAKVSFQEAVAAERRRDSLLVDWRKSIGQSELEAVRPAPKPLVGDPFAVRTF